MDEVGQIFNEKAQYDQEAPEPEVEMITNTKLHST